MDISTVSPLVTKQVIVMLLIIAAGYSLTKYQIITEKGSAEMSGVLVNIVTPCVLIRAYHVPIDYSQVTNMIIGCAISILIHIIYLMLAHLYFIRIKARSRAIVSKYSAILSNCGFMAIPLLQACLGDTGTFYGSSYLGVFNVFVWSVVKSQFDNTNKKFSLKDLINPGIIGVTLGVLFYITQIKLPDIAFTAVSFVADLNTPLAMIILGSFLARSGIIKSLKSINVYSVVFFKLIIAPILLLIVMRLLNIDKVLAMAMIICAGCPSATMVPIFAQQYDSDYTYATNIAVTSTIISMITIPLLCYVCGFIL